MTPQTMRVLYAFPEPLPLPRARGVQVVHAIHSLAREVASIDFAFEPVPGHPDPFAAYGLRCPANVRLLPLSRHLPWPFHGLRLRSHRLFAARLRKTVVDHPPDVVLVRHIKLARALERDLPSVPLAYEAHEVFADTTQSRRPGAIATTEAAAVKGAALLIANSQATAARLLDRYHPQARVEVLPNGVNIPHLPVERDWREASQKIVYAGSLFGWKGVDDLVDAAALLPGFTIDIIGGSSTEIARLEKRAAGGARLAFAGRLAHADTLARIGGACIAVLPNRPDPDSRFTSPLKLFEYLAAGCAVVTSDLPAIREILAGDEAEWFPPGNAAELAAAIRRLADDPARAQAMASRGRARAASFSWPNRARRLAALLSEIAHDR